MNIKDLKPAMAKAANRRKELHSFLEDRLARMQAELMQAPNVALCALVQAGYLLPTEDWSALNLYQVFNGVDYEESLADNMASIEEDCRRFMKAARG